MCKIVVIPKITKQTQKNAWSFAHAITKPMAKHDKDGFGFAALGPSGIFGARYLSPKDAWRADPSAIDAIFEPYGPLLEPIAKANAFGAPDDAITCLILHARTATNAVNLTNTHPFVNADGTTALIHNGVITNSHAYQRTSTCDSEAILTRYLDAGTPYALKNLNDALSPLQGYFACAAITQTDTGYALDVFKDNRASLYAVHVPKLSGIVFATDAAHVQAACKTLGWACGQVTVVADNVAMRHDATTGTLTDMVKLNALTQPSWQSQWDKSLGASKTAALHPVEPLASDDAPSYRDDDRRYDALYTDAYTDFKDLPDDDIDPLEVDALINRRLKVGMR